MRQNKQRVLRENQARRSEHTGEEMLYMERSIRAVATKRPRVAPALVAKRAREREDREKEHRCTSQILGFTVYI